MAINFPPTTDQPTDGSFVFTDQGYTYKWYGYWRSSPAVVDPADLVTQDQLTTALAAYLEKAGDVATGSITTPEREIITAMDLSAGPFWTAAGIDIPNPTNCVAGMTGTIRLTGSPTSWGGYFKFVDGAAPAPVSFPAMVPFYVQNATTILVGNAVEGIV